MTEKNWLNPELDDDVVDRNYAFSFFSLVGDRLDEKASSKQQCEAQAIAATI